MTGREPSPFRPHRTLQRMYPEVAAGGYTRYDGFVEFYQRVNALLGPESEVLDFGAGRGNWTDIGLSDYHRRLRDLQRIAKKVDGIDVDPVVLENPSLDDAKVMRPGEPLPYADNSYDLIVSDHVLEHVSAADAPGVSAELLRVLKPGGWFAARTPNKWGIIGIGARAVPNDLHVRVLDKLQPGRLAEDVFPVQYAMNTRRDLKRLFPADLWNVSIYGHASEPQYVGTSEAAWRVASFVDRITPPRALPTLMIFVQKKP